MTYNTNDETPAERPLKAYAFDPSQGRNLGNFMTVPVRYEKLQTLALVEAPKVPKGPALTAMSKGFVQGDFWYDYLIKL